MLPFGITELLFWYHLVVSWMSQSQQNIFSITRAHCDVENTTRLFCLLVHHTAMLKAPFDCIDGGQKFYDECTFRLCCCCATQWMWLHHQSCVTELWWWMHHHQVLLVHYTVKWSVLINVDCCAGTSHGCVSVVIVVNESEVLCVCPMFKVNTA